MSQVEILLAGNDSVLEVSGLINGLTGALLQTATVTVTLIDSEGVNVVGESWPKTLAHVAAVPGTYRTTLPYTLDVAAGDRLTATITANAGAGLRAQWVVPVTVHNRTE